MLCAEFGRFAPLAQWTEQRRPKPCVVRSNRTGGTEARLVVRDFYVRRLVGKGIAIPKGDVHP